MSMTRIAIHVGLEQWFEAESKSGISACFSNSSCLYEDHPWNLPLHEYKIQGIT